MSDILCTGGCGKRIPYIDNPDFHICNDCYRKHQEYWEQREAKENREAYERLSPKAKKLNRLIENYIKNCGYAVGIDLVSHRYDLVKFVAKHL